MNESKEMTARDVLENTLNELKAISVPVQYANEIARPIWNAVTSIQAILDAMQEAPEEAEEVKENV